MVRRKTKTVEATIRASEADIVLQCGAATKPVKHEIDISGPEAAIGRAAHDAIEHWIKAGDKGPELPEPQPAANRHGVQPAEIIDLIEAAPGMLNLVREDLSRAEAEVDVIGGGVRGRMDVFAVTMTASGPYCLSVLDWKTGREPWSSTKPGQRLAYASAVEATHGMPASGYIYTAELWLATGTVIESRIDADTIEGFRARLAEQRQRQTASPGPHCKYCRRRHECDERNVYLRATAETLRELPTDAPPAELLAGLWDQSRLLRQALDNYERAIDTAIDELGELPLPDGRVLAHGKKTLTTIDARKAWPVMVGAGLDHEAINSALKVSKTKLVEIVKRRAPRGKKGEAAEQLLNNLDSAGAIDRRVSRYRRVAGAKTTE